MHKTNIVAAVMAGSLVLPVAAAWAGNESTYRVPTGNAGVVLCSYNQRDALRITAKETVYIVEGSEARLGCSDKKPLFQSRPDSCQVKVAQANLSPRALVDLGILLGIFSAVQVTNIVSAIITTGKISGDVTKQVCNNLALALAGPAAKAVKVPKGSCKVVSKSASFSNC